MSGAIFRVRRRLRELMDSADPVNLETVLVLQDAIAIIDAELERDAEHDFTRPLNPNPVTALARAAKTIEHRISANDA